MKNLFAFRKECLHEHQPGQGDSPDFRINKPGKKYENPKARKTIFGTKYWVPLIDKMGDPLIETQPELYAVIDKLYSRFEGAFIDVGVNVGQTLVKVHAINPEIPYFGFETNINACFFVDQFLQMNRAMKNYVVFPIALSDGVHLLKLFRKGLVGAGGSIIEKHRDSHTEFKHQQPILTVDGDQVLDALGQEKIGVIKVDVEGGELEVLKGLRGSLQRYRPFVICESKPIRDSRTNESEENAHRRNERRREIEALMAELGFEIFQIQLDGTFTRVSEIDPTEQVTRDYLFVPKEIDRAHPLFFPSHE